MDEEDAKLKEMMVNFREEVEKLGVSAMDYKSRKNVEAEKLVKLGMKKEKVRCGARRASRLAIVSERSTT